MSETSLVGVWTPISYVITDEKGEVVNAPFGQDPPGLLIYTDDGYMSAQLASTNRPHFSQENLRAASDREKAQAADTFTGYSGTLREQLLHLGSLGVPGHRDCFLVDSSSACVYNKEWPVVLIITEVTMETNPCLFSCRRNM
jgi:hypothetical protein